jgi:NAD(P)-dependent dehydrogenase (short-subunit alcohol dehydrogenase family)
MAASMAASKNVTRTRIAELFRVDGLRVLVTGGGRGIGLNIASAFVANGADVFISSRKAEALETVAEKLTADGPGRCAALPADLAAPGGVEALAVALERHPWTMGPNGSPRLDVLVNNSGATWGGELGHFPEHGFDKILRLNLTAVFMLTQRLLPMLEAAGDAERPARIINIGSVDGGASATPRSARFSFAPSYAASKAGLAHMSRLLALRLAERHVTCNVVAPGPFDTKMMAHSLDQLGQREALPGVVPLGRIGLPDDMAGSALFLASRAGRWVTGATIVVDGGIALL